MKNLITPTLILFISFVFFTPFLTSANVYVDTVYYDHDVDTVSILLPRYTTSFKIYCAHPLDTIGDGDFLPSPMCTCPHIVPGQIGMGTIEVVGEGVFELTFPRIPYWVYAIETYTSDKGLLKRTVVPMATRHSEGFDIQQFSTPEKITLEMYNTQQQFVGEVTISYGDFLKKNYDYASLLIQLGLSRGVYFGKPKAIKGQGDVNGILNCAEAVKIRFL